MGDWRDSGTGLGYGKYPFDVNGKSSRFTGLTTVLTPSVALVPAALRAIASLAQAGILPSNYTNVSSYASIWEQNAYTFFNVSISPSAAQASLQNYVQAANLSTTLLYGPGSLNGTNGTQTSANSSSSSSPGFGDSSQVIGGGASNSTFFALSLKNDTTPVEVLNSDLGFVLLYGNNVSESIITATVEALQPYPRGLLTNVGMVVANAAYDSNTTDIETFNYQQYHGAVVWSWQQALMASGISKQLGLCGLSNSTQLQANIMGKCRRCSHTYSFSDTEARRHAAFMVQQHEPHRRLDASPDPIVGQHKRVQFRHLQRSLHPSVLQRKQHLFYRRFRQRISVGHRGRRTSIVGLWFPGDSRSTNRDPCRKWPGLSSDAKSVGESRAFRIGAEYPEGRDTNRVSGESKGQRADMEEK